MVRRVQIWRRMRAEMLYIGHALRVLARPLIGMAVVVVVGATIHHFFGGTPAARPTWSDAFFVSYCLLFLEHIEAVPHHPLAQAVHYLQPLLGVILVSEGILRLGLGLLDRERNARTWMSIMAATTSDHVIVCGLGTVGFRITEELRGMGVEVFAVEADPDGVFLDRARELGVRVQTGDARADNVLRSLNVDAARAVIVATDDDLANLEIAMDVRDMRADVPIVLRLFDQRLADKVKGTLGVQVSVSTSRLAAPLFASAALHPAIRGTHQVGGHTLVVVELDVQAGSRLEGCSVGELAAQRMGVVAVRSGDGEWVPQPAVDRVVQRGDQVQVLAAADAVDEARAWAEA